MSKKSKLIIALITLCTISSAQSLDTFRLGLNIGNSRLEVKSHALNMKKLKKDSYYAGVFVGYDHLIPESPIFIGLEGEISNHKTEKNTDITITGANTIVGAPPAYDPGLDATLKLASNNSKIIALRLGVAVNQSLIYGKVGIAQTNFKTRVTTPEDNVERKIEKLGMVIGAGFEASLNKNYIIGIEHTFSDYNAMERIHHKSRAILLPNIHTTKLRLVYSF